MVTDDLEQPRRTPPTVDVDALVRCASCLRPLDDEPGPDDTCAGCYQAPDG